jgi:hypothetical protein
MKPINLQESGCDPVSSNCIVWQGPDIACLSLCKGDSVSTVVFKLATELCELMDTFDITNYDLSCLNLTQCSPEDFQSLIQLLINKICELNNITPPTPGGTTTGCPDCTVAIASCFYYTNPLGDTVTSMQLSDYVLAIGNRICTIVNQNGTITGQVLDHENRLLVLENEPDPIFPMPKITPTCILPVVSTDIDVVVKELESQFCTLRQYTGTPIEIMSAVNAMCSGLSTQNKLNGVGSMSTIPGWIQDINLNNLAHSFNNIWLTICDLRNAVSFIQSNCCTTGCDSIVLDVDGEVTSPTTLRLIFTGTIPNNYIDAPVSASSITIQNSSGGVTQYLNNVAIKSGYYDAGLPLNIMLDNPPSGNQDLLVTITSRFYDSTTASVCESFIQMTVLGLTTCPTMILTPSYTTLDYAFTWNGTLPATIIVQLTNSTGSTVLASNVVTISSSAVSGMFINLLSGTAYGIRLSIGGNICPLVPFSTVAYPCVAPTLIAPTLTYTTPEGTITGITINAWQAEYNFYHP